MPDPTPPTPLTPLTPDTLAPGTRVTVTQQVQLKNWTASITGVIQEVEQRKTGSWFAHSKDDRLWLDRLILRKDDGEIVVCNLDAYSRVEVTDAPSEVGAVTRTGDISAGASKYGASTHPGGADVHGIAEGALKEEPDAFG